MFFSDTLTVQQESSLEEMQKQALYISQDIITVLQEIGEGSSTYLCRRSFITFLHA